MKLANASKRFNNDRILDGYTAAFLFKAHTSAHDDHTSSGATARRRTMRTVPGTTAPARRVVQIYSDYWLVGNSNLDSYGGFGIRQSYGLKKSTGLVALLTLSEACLSSAGTPFHAQKEFYRDTANPLTESETDVMWNVFCPYTEPVVKGSFLRQGADLMRVRSLYTTVDEYLIAETDQFDADALQAATFTTNSKINLVTDAATVISTATTVIQTDQAKFYRFRDEAEASRKPGDRTVFVAGSALTPVIGSTFTMLGKPWRAHAVVPEGTGWALLARLT